MASSQHLGQESKDIRLSCVWKAMQTLGQEMVNVNLPLSAYSFAYQEKKKAASISRYI